MTDVMTTTRCARSLYDASGVVLEAGFVESPQSLPVHTALSFKRDHPGAFVSMETIERQVDQRRQREAYNIKPDGVAQT